MVYVKQATAERFLMVASIRCLVANQAGSSYEGTVVVGFQP